MTRPIVAATLHYDVASWGGWIADAVITHDWYPKRLREAGFRVVLVPPDPELDDLLDRVDAVMVTGGADINPALYGGAPHPAVETDDDERDEAELALIRGAWDRDLPFLGVCRGHQMLAVASGGTLIPHLPDVTQVVHQEDPGGFVQHEIQVEDGTRLAGIIGSGSMAVNSSHHQAVLDPGRLHVSARSTDGLIEACEDPTRTFFLGVQWHPEAPDQRTGLELFGALADAARAYRAGFRS